MMLKAGVGSFDMSPQAGIELAGYPHYPRHNTGVHDPLIASCFYLEQGDARVALVTLDILFFSKKYVQQARQQIRERTGYHDMPVFICCSHTHSGPWASGRLDLEALQMGADVDADYVRFLVDGIADMVADAASAPFVASIGTGFSRCGAEKGVGGNRRERGGLCDDTVSALAVRDAGGEVRGILAHYTLHPTFIHEDSALVTADYPGFIRAEMRRRHPNAVFGFAQGASGDQSSRYFRIGQSYDEAERVGLALASAAESAISSMHFDADPALDVLIGEVPFSLRTYGPLAQLRRNAEACVAEYGRLKATGADYLTLQNANLRMLGAEDLLGYATMLDQGMDIPLLRDEGPAEVVALRLGDALIVGLPGECFVAYQLRIKHAFEDGRVIVIALANGCLPGYCYTEDALAEGGYEVDTSMLTPAFGAALTDCAIGLLSRLKGAGA